jgi:hypothetical protein
MTRRQPRRLDWRSAITPETLRTVLWEAKVLRPPDRLTAEAEAKFATGLEHIRELYRIDQTLEPVNAARRKTREALDAANDTLGEIEKETRNFLADAEHSLAATPDWRDGPLIIKCLRSDLDEIYRLRGLLVYASRSPILEERQNNARKWTQLALPVFYAFREAMRSVKPIKYGVSNNGPVGRFFKHVVPLLTGEDTTPQSAATQLKKRLREVRRPDQ